MSTMLEAIENTFQRDFKIKNWPNLVEVFTVLLGKFEALTAAFVFVELGASFMMQCFDISSRYSFFSTALKTNYMK